MNVSLKRKKCIITVNFTAIARCKPNVGVSNRKETLSLRDFKNVSVISHEVVSCHKNTLVGIVHSEDKPQ